MKIHNSSVRRMHKPLLSGLGLLIILSMTGCTLGQPSTDQGQDQTILQTQMALGVQQTMMAAQAEQGSEATIQAQQATMVAQAAQATQIAQQATDMAQQAIPPTVDTAATDVALSVQATLAAQGGSQPPADTQPSPPTDQSPPPEPSGGDFQTMMKSANILLYEDIVNQPRLVRYVKKTLDTMGLSYKDDGSAKGWFKSDLLSGGPGGNGWDLIIIALEFRTGISGEFFTYVNQALNAGTPVILEIWYLDQISGGEVSTILTKCGVELDSNYVGKTRSPQDIIIWPLPGATDHPVMREPNAGLTFTDVWTTWSYDDLGDLLQKTGRGDAQLLLGTIATQANDHGVLAVCMDGMLTLQTYSSHSYPFNIVYPMWENMIYNALMVRLLGQ